MNIIFGRLIGAFSEYFVPQTTVTEEAFKATVNKNRQVSEVEHGFVDH